MELKEYLVKWFVPQLADWVLVGNYRTLGAARSGRDLFIQKMEGYWVGQIGIVERVEREVE